MIRFTILGEPASLKNSRELATIGPRDKRRTIVRKSDKALGFEADALMQIPAAARQRLEGPVRIWIRIWYASELSDLDEAIVLDVLQDRYGKAPKGADGKALGPRPLLRGGVYRNDRQVREKHVFHAIDRKNPRVEIWVEAMQVQQQDLAA